MTDLEQLVRIFSENGVRYVVIGGVALVLQGSSRVTQDLDICYARTRDNLDALARSLGPFHPRLRGAPPELPFLWDAQTLRSGLNFTLATDIGDVDLLGDVPGLGGFDEVHSLSVAVSLFGHQVLLLGLDGLERAKRAAGRPKDLLDLEEIRALKKR
ncbi:hypothetical protein LZC95_07515 [Pendulispora brunnea]|uniref:Nucleotidyl transferase n=1 Tax=Pendulispora brunnea TaxID=2905690 RepID=A0ABZ2KGL0_9BACT